MKTIISILFLFQVVVGFSQPSITWNKTFDGGFNEDDAGNKIIQDTDSTYYLAGDTRNHGSSIIKINDYGNIIWMRNYMEIGKIYSVAKTGSNLLAVGTQCKFLKINTNGDIIWAKSYINEYVDELYEIVYTSDGGFIACGRSSNQNGYIVKIDSSGNLIWRKIFNENNFYIKLTSIIQGINSNEYLITGFKFGYNQQNYVLLIKVTDAGELIYNNGYICEGTYGRKIIRKNSYYLILTDLGFTSINDSGTQLYYKRINLPTNVYNADFNIYDNNKFISTSYRFLPVDSLISYISIFDTNGTILLSKTFNFCNYVNLPALVRTINGDVIAFGEADFIPYQTDYYAVRVDSLLNSPPIGINNNTHRIPEEFLLHQNYPNPFNPLTKIKYDIPKDAQVTLKIYDILGKEIYSSNEFKKAGRYEFEFDGSNYASGLYFYRIETDKFTDTKKMVLVK